jgi:hypothetical protein
MKCPAPAAPAAPAAPPAPRCRAAASHTRNRSDRFVAARLNPYRIRPDSRRQRKAKWDHFVAARLNLDTNRPRQPTSRPSTRDLFVAARSKSGSSGTDSRPRAALDGQGRDRNRLRIKRRKLPLSLRSRRLGRLGRLPLRQWGRR